MAKVKSDDRVQSIGVYVVETVVDEGGYTKFPTTISASEKTGIEITRITYDVILPDTSLNQVAGIAMAVGQIATNFPEPESNLSLNNYPTGTLDKCTVLATGDIGVAGDFKTMHSIIHDFSNTPLLAHPAALYAQIISANAGVTAKANIILHFRYVTLSDAEFMDLLQGYIVQNAI